MTLRTNKGAATPRSHPPVTATADQYSVPTRLRDCWIDGIGTPMHTYSNWYSIKSWTFYMGNQQVERWTCSPGVLTWVLPWSNSFNCFLFLQLISPGTLCREQARPCDLPEYCTGKSPFCPANFYQLDGTPCASGRAYCYSGMCLTYEQQCLQLWGYGKEGHVTKWDGGLF